MMTFKFLNHFLKGGFVLVTFLITSHPVFSAVDKTRFEKLELFNKVLFLIENQYYREVDTEKLIQGALKGMMSTLDPHSSFLGKEVFSKMQEETRGEFGGLGIEVTQKDGVLVVTTPIDDTPAFRAGIKAGDKIVEINHESTLGITLEKAVEIMRGKANTKIIVGIIRVGVEGIKQFTLKRQIIKVTPVKSEVIDDNYIYIRLSQFQKRSAVSIAAALKKHKKNSSKKKEIKGIILDLRSNPGGLLEEAVNVSSLFMKDGIVVSTEGRDPKNKEIKYVKKSGYKELKMPLVVVINGSSASASEIVAGALQDSGRALILGTRSFGKGSVQTVAKIDDEKGVKLTIAQYMTPKGRKIQAIGIDPDVELGMIEGPWSKVKRDPNYVREKDLRGHLTATKETPEEKKLRLSDEKIQRLERVKRIKEKQLKKKKIDGIPKKYDPKDDFQIIQAVNVLKSFKMIKKLQK